MKTSFKIAAIFLLIILSFSKLFAQSVGINSDGSEPDNRTILHIKSNNKGVLFPKLTEVERDALLLDVPEGMLIFNTTDKQLQIFLNSSWYPLSIGPSETTFSCGDPLLVIHSYGNISPMSKTVTYGTVQTNLTGSNKCWITQNLGADQQATSVNDDSEASAGWYWQFNRKQGYKHNGTTLTPGWGITSISESSDWQIDNDPCSSLLGVGWRLPTQTEWQTADGGWNNWNDTFSSVLKLHAAGNLSYSDGSLNNRGLIGWFWSSTGYNNTMGWDKNFGSTTSDMGSNSKANGCSVRCLKD